MTNSSNLCILTLVMLRGTLFLSLSLSLPHLYNGHQCGTKQMLIQDFLLLGMCSLEKGVVILACL